MYLKSTWVNKHGMKRTRSGRYEGCMVPEGANVTFDPEKVEATSFRWWYFVKRIGGKVVFNDYSYSSYTRRHQNKVKLLMKELGIKTDVIIEAPGGLQNLGAAIQHYNSKIKGLIAAIQKPGSRAAKNKERARDVRDLQKRVQTLLVLIAAEARHD